MAKNNSRDFQKNKFVKDHMDTYNSARAEERPPMLNNIPKQTNPK